MEDALTKAKLDFAEAAEEYLAAAVEMQKDDGEWNNTPAPLKKRGFVAFWNFGIGPRIDFNNDGGDKCVPDRLDHKLAIAWLRLMHARGDRAAGKHAANALASVMTQRPIGEFYGKSARRNKGGLEQIPDPTNISA